MSKKWITTPRIEGKSSRQAHCDLPEGTYERELGKEGFFGPAAHMYHPRPPTAWSNFEGPLRPRAFDTNQHGEYGPSPWDAKALVHNSKVRVRTWRVEGTQSMDLLLIEATNSSYMLPDKGLLGPHAIFDPAMLDAPQLDPMFKRQQQGEWRVVVKRLNALSTITYGYNPLDAVGWHGDLFPVRINVKDIRPIMSHRYHVPPSAHTTFVADRFVVCTFVPRLFETDPGAIKIPFFHNNDDFDELIFYHRGDFFSRDNIKPGMVTLHPCGFTHGPHPKALGRMLEQTKAATDEYAVMIDTRDALEVSAEAGAVEWTGYVDSWK